MKENYFCLPKINHNRNHGPKKLALLEEIIKPIQGFIIHVYKIPYAIQGGR